MRFNQMWEKLVAKKPNLTEPHAEVTIKAEQFKSLLWKFYENGYDESTQDSADSRRDSSESANFFDDLFGGFGSR